MQVVESQDGSDLYAHDLDLNVVFSEDAKGHTSPSKIGSIPSSTASNFRLDPTGGFLVFSANVYPDGDLKTVGDQDKEWEERGNSALVYDTTYVRHWDVWQGRKSPQLFSVKIEKGDDGNWKLGENFTSPLKGTRHVSQQCCSVCGSVCMTLFDSILPSSLSVAWMILTFRKRILFTLVKTRHYQKLGTPSKMSVEFSLSSCRRSYKLTGLHSANLWIQKTNRVDVW